MGVFIPSAQARPVNQAGWHFLASYGRLALLCHEANMVRFKLIPKLHMYWHLVDWMDVHASSVAYVHNCMSESCSMEEDLIGRYCFLTRCVSPRVRVIRSLERYLTQVKLLWGWQKGFMGMGHSCLVSTFSFLYSSIQPVSLSLSYTHTHTLSLSFSLSFSPSLCLHLFLSLGLSLPLSLCD